MTHEFFHSDTPHGLVKRIMYKKYLQAFIPITQQAKTKRPFKTVIIDGFAGAGRYGEEWPDKIESYGSPLIALMVSLNYFYKKQHGKDKSWGKQPTERDTDAEIVDLVATMTLSGQVEPSIHLYFIEADAENFNRLTENIAEVLDDFFPNPDTSYIENKGYCLTENGENVELCTFNMTHPCYPIVCSLVNAEFVKFVRPYEIEDYYAKCLVFLDPFGYSQIPMSHVKNFSGPGNSLLINFMSSYVNRFLSTNEATIGKLFGMDYIYDEFVNGKPFPESLPKSLDKYSSYLFNLSQFAGQPLNNIQNCAAAYEECLRRFFETDLSITFEMRGGNNCIVYHLIFVTDHMKSLEIMKDSMNLCSQVENGFSMSDYKFYRNGCQLNLANTQDISLVADAIYDKFEGCSKVKISQIEEYVLLYTPYVFRKKPLTMMVKEKDPRISEVVGTGEKHLIRKGTFPPGTEWVLKFSWKPITTKLAIEVFSSYLTNSVKLVPLSAIKNDFFSHQEYSVMNNALVFLASKGYLGVYNKVENVGDYVQTHKEIVDNERERFVVFRPSLESAQSVAPQPVLTSSQQTSSMMMQPIAIQQSFIKPTDSLLQTVRVSDKHFKFENVYLFGNICYKRVEI